MLTDRSTKEKPTSMTISPGDVYYVVGHSIEFAPPEKVSLKKLADAFPTLNPKHPSAYINIFSSLDIANLQAKYPSKSEMGPHTFFGSGKIKYIN